ncbi:AMP-binding protein [Eubacteriaceae bacterium ES3]|nr:AMP-binding protein [Eubacteriaceae bacterium ES3]
MKNLDNWISQKIFKPDFSEKELKTYQLKCLKESLNRAFVSSRYYREKFKVNPVDMMFELEDIKKLPFTDENDLRLEPMDFLAISPKKVKKIVTLKTSGTTGLAKRIFFSASDLSLTVDFFKNGMGIFTKSGDRVLVLLPGEVPGSIGDLLKTALEKLGAQAYIYGVVKDANAVSKLILEEKITGIVGIPRQLLEVSQQAEAEAIQAAGYLRSVLLSTDYVSPALSRRLALKWGVEVFEHYGSTEMGYGGGVFCPAKTGYHLREADLYFEIIDPETGFVVPDGQWGEVVFTTLSREAMPLIRYRTGDYGRFLRDNCPCKTNLKTMERISGRRENIVKLGAGQILSLSQLEDVLFGYKAVLDFTVAIKQTEKDGVVVELGLIFSGSEDDFAKLKRKLKKKIKDLTAFKGRIKIFRGSIKEIDQKAMRKERILDSRNE